jgi:GAF domain-containing protein
MKIADSPAPGAVPGIPITEKQSLFLPQIIDFAIVLTRADKGNIQVIDPETETLVIAASRGFDPTFLGFFARVAPGPGTICGIALASRQRVIIEDVDASGIFEGRAAALEVMQTAEVRAVHSLPIVSRSGRPWGVINMHWRRQFPEADYDQSLLQYLTEETGEFLEREAEQPQAPG